MAAAAAPATPNADTDRRAQQCAQKWIGELGVSEKAQKRWLERAKKITRLYKREQSTEESKRRFAMLWSNTETIKPTVYARPPEPVVSRRFDDADPTARSASEVLERSLSYSIDCQDLDGRLKECRDDYVLIGRGQSWERYVPTHGPQVVPEVELQVISDGEGSDQDTYELDGEPYDGDDVTVREDGTAFKPGEPYRPVIYEESVTDYVNWEDFGHSVARTWNEVWYVWRRVYLDREDLIKRFGPLGKLIPLDWGPVQKDRNAPVDSEMQRKAAVYEIWDRSAKKVYWISKSWSSRPLDERDDPLGLDGFFPCPRPLLATTANDSVIPTADYVFYQDQAEEIDKLTARIAELQDALKVRGFYAGDGKTNLNNLFSAANNMLIPVPDWMRLKEGGGARGMVEYWPIDLVVNALKALVEQRQQLVNDVYQLTGIGDVLRGMNDPRATATAERIKGAWGTLRIRDKQKEMIRFARDGLRIKAQVIAAKFDPETLKQISGVKLPTEAEKQALQGQLQAQAIQAQQQAALAAQQAQQAPQGPPGAPPGMMGHNGGPPMPPEPSEEQQAILASPTWEDVIGLLRNEAARSFRIDIETDSTIEPDEQEQKASAVELVGAISSFIAQWGPQVQAQPALAPLAAELLKFSVRKFRAGRELEAVIEQTMAKIMAAPPPQQQAEAKEPPDTTPIVVQQLRNQQEQIKQEGENQRADVQAQVDVRGQDLDADAMRAKLSVVPKDPNPQVAV